VLDCEVNDFIRDLFGIQLEGFWRRIDYEVRILHREVVYTFRTLPFKVIRWWQLLPSRVKKLWYLILHDRKQLRERLVQRWSRLRFLRQTTRA